MKIYTIEESCYENLNEVLEKMQEISSKGRFASAKDSSKLASLQILNEAMARGVQFLGADLYESEISKFKIEEGKIRLPFVTVSSLGESAAEGIIDARKNGKFISILDLKERTKITKAIIEVMRESGILDGMQESNQISLF